MEIPTVRAVKLSFEYIAKAVGIPTDCCSVLDDDEWLAVGSGAPMGDITLDHLFTYIAINMALLKINPRARTLPLSGVYTRAELFNAVNANVLDREDPETPRRSYLQTVYENALRQGLGTRDQRGAFLVDELGL